MRKVAARVVERGGAVLVALLQNSRGLYTKSDGSTKALTPDDMASPPDRTYLRPL